MFRSEALPDRVIGSMAQMSPIVLFNLKSSSFVEGKSSHDAQPVEYVELSSANTTKPDLNGQAFNRSACHSEFLGGLIYFGLLLVARATRL